MSESEKLNLYEKSSFHVKSNPAVEEIIKKYGKKKGD
jgi:hypothetical protein